LIAFDEGAGPEEATPTLLAERIGLHLSGLRGDPPSGPALDRQDVDRAREALQRMAFDEDAAEALCAIADRFAVGSIRAVTFALRAARAWAALNGRKAIAEDDLLMAARLVLVPRAGALEAIQPEPEPEAAPPPDTSTNDETPEPSQTDAAADRVIDAVRASLPDGLLDQLASQLAARKAHAAGRGAGPKARAARRGAPLPSRPGALGAGDVLDLTATLRAAAPWRRVRTPPPGARTVVPLRGSDFRVRRFKQRQEQSIVFAVDASGSMAAQRLGEAKGAVEHLLAQAYVTRAHAALIAFRQQSAEVLLAPTRSLAAAKRRLAELPGGGATPLAAAIEAAVRVAVSERSRQRTPLIVFLTDGRGNVGRDGAPGRAAAEADALAAADLVRAAGLSTVLIDTSPHARPQAAALADRMGASYVALPIVDAGRVAEIVRAHAPVG
jgi:magnesium chelatase subunit D